MWVITKFQLTNMGKQLTTNTGLQLGSQEVFNKSSISVNVGKLNQDFTVSCVKECMFLYSHIESTEHSQYGK
jgi:hypothetical protein